MKNDQTDANVKTVQDCERKCTHVAARRSWCKQKTERQKNESDPHVSKTAAAHELRKRNDNASRINLRRSSCLYCSRHGKATYCPRRRRKRKIGKEKVHTQPLVSGEIVMDRWSMKNIIHHLNDDIKSNKDNNQIATEKKCNHRCCTKCQVCSQNCNCLPETTNTASTKNDISPNLNETKFSSHREIKSDSCVDIKSNIFHDTANFVQRKSKEKSENILERDVNIRCFSGSQKRSQDDNVSSIKNIEKSDCYNKGCCITPKPEIKDTEIREIFNNSHDRSDVKKRKIEQYQILGNIGVNKKCCEGTNFFARRNNYRNYLSNNLNNNASSDECTCYTNYLKKAIGYQYRKQYSAVNDKNKSPIIDRSEYDKHYFRKPNAHLLNTASPQMRRRRIFSKNNIHKELHSPCYIKRRLIEARKTESRWNKNQHLQPNKELNISITSSSNNEDRQLRNQLYSYYESTENLTDFSKSSNSRNKKICKCLHRKHQKNSNFYDKSSNLTSSSSNDFSSFENEEYSHTSSTCSEADVTNGLIIRPITTSTTSTYIFHSREDHKMRKSRQKWSSTTRRRKSRVFIKRSDDDPYDAVFCCARYRERRNNPTYLPNNVEY